MAIPFVQAANFTTANRGKGDILFIVIHDMEMAEKPTTAEACAAYFARSTTQASSHYTVDNDSIVQCVRDKDIAWCAPGCNGPGLHLEHAGFASQTRGDWLDPFGKAMLAKSAGLVAAKCHEYGIDPRKGDYLDIRAGRACIVGHWDVTKAYPDKGSHTDPGANFPWDYYIGLVQAAYNGTTDTTQEDTLPTVNEVWTTPLTKTGTIGGADANESPLAILTRLARNVEYVAALEKAQGNAASIAAEVVKALPASSAVDVGTLSAAFVTALKELAGPTA